MIWKGPVLVQLAYITFLTYRLRRHDFLRAVAAAAPVRR